MATRWPPLEVNNDLVYKVSTNVVFDKRWFRWVDVEYVFQQSLLPHLTGIICLAVENVLTRLRQSKQVAQNPD